MENEEIKAETKEAPPLSSEQLAEKENELAKREEAVNRAEEKNAKERLYDKIHVSPKALDIFIGVCVALIAIFLVLGILT